MAHRVVCLSESSRGLRFGDVICGRRYSVGMSNSIGWHVTGVVSKQANLISTKLQDNLRHITYKHKLPIRCTPRLNCSIHNYIVTTI